VPKRAAQLVEANYGLTAASANGGGVAFFGHVGGFVFGAIVARALSRGETLERSRRVAVTTSRR
jgi:membrane associated rhomboid family serine protease